MKYIKKFESGILNRFKEFLKTHEGVEKQPIKWEELSEFIDSSIQGIKDIGFNVTIGLDSSELVISFKAVEEIMLEDLCKELLYLNPILKSEGLIASGFVMFRGRRSEEQDNKIISDLGNVWTNHMTIDDISTRVIKYHLNLTGEGFVIPKMEKILKDINTTNRYSFRQDEYYDSVEVSDIWIKIIAI